MRKVGVSPSLVRLVKRANEVVRKNIATLELIGVVMRIASFGVVSWSGSNSPFLVVWLINTVDATLLTWCAMLKRDKAYTFLNSFWLLVGTIGMVRVWVSVT
ncbi:hypothetical protein C7415_11473 [Cupriavidus alkaliphilus]|nr:hypothetical protein C7415_11473 [Cupriavidus alkaliphilus]